ncbi:MAG TPA: hypothetical protein VJR89_24815 [Polyangiales bacterium]|nr:hypothetical protein [Polyangiales bacterium]
MSRRYLPQLIGLLCSALCVAQARAQTTEPAVAQPEAPAVDAPALPPAEAAAASSSLEERVKALEAKVETQQQALDEAATAAMMQESSTESTEEPAVSLYGFMDFGIDHFFVDDDVDSLALLRPTSATTFVFGNLNVYLDATPLPNLRSLVELRLTLAPHGEETALGPPLSTSYERVDTVAFDFSSPSSQAQMRLGSLFIERAWTQYKFSELFTLQWGMFLNPFGIWNLDHGSPTLISLVLPTFIASQMVPTRLLGVHLYGSTFVGDSWQLGYYAHVSNGRTPLDFDLDEEKGIGARVFASNEGDYGKLVLGASGYTGQYSDQYKKLNPMGENVFDWVETVSYREHVLGFDVAVDLGDLRVRSEAVLRWVLYKDGLSEQIFAQDGSEQYLPSRLEYDAYILAAYLTSIGIEPYFQFEISEKSYVLPRWGGSSRATQTGLHPLSPSVGFNYHLTTHTIFKAQFVYGMVYTANFEELDTKEPYMFLRVVNTF